MDTDSRKLLGGIAEAKVLNNLIGQGYNVFLPFLDNGSIDLIAVKNNKVLRVSVKGTSIKRKDSWLVTVKTVSRRKDSITVNHFDNTSCDILAIYIQPLDQVLLLDAARVTCKGQMNLKIDDNRVYKED